MVISYSAKENNWLWNHTAGIGNWMFTKVLSYAEDKDEQIHLDWIEISDSEKLEKEQEQEEYFKPKDE